jgi:hypothetical protein
MFSLSFVLSPFFCIMQTNLYGWSQHSIMVT